MTSANFAVHADAIIPVSGPENVLKSHSIVVRQGLIDALMPHAQARALSDIDHVELPDHVLMPGLVNAHGHAGMTLLLDANLPLVFTLALLLGVYLF